MTVGYFYLLFSGFICGPRVIESSIGPYKVWNGTNEWQLGQWEKHTIKELE